MIVDEAGMVGTDDLRHLLTATTTAKTKTVLVGDPHQLAPVKARGGMFAQLCADLPWTQKLSQVWRMRDPAERSASLAVREGGLAPVRRAVEWYRSHGRLHTGDPVAMATDALASYRADVAAVRNALLVCDTTEMCDALNRRIHDNTVDNDAPAVAAARGQRIGVGDLIISRRNDPTLGVYDATDINTPARDPVRNGHRWQVFAVDTEHNRIAARRLDDGARAAFTGDYLREHITHGYAVTVHSAQGVTAERTHAVLGENTSRNLLYVAMTRGRDTNMSTCTSGSPGKASTNIPSPPPVCTCPAAAAAATPPTSCAPSSPTATNRPAPPTTSPPKPKTASSCPTAFKVSWTAAPKPWPPGETTTRHGAVRPATGSSIGN